MAGVGISIRAYADSRRERGLPGGTPWAVQKALRSGRIRKNADGKIDPAQADADWDRQTSPARQTADRSVDGPQGGPSLAQPAGLEFAQARAVRELYAARLARLEFEERQGKLVSVDQMKVEIFRKARQVRDRMMAIPGRVADQLAGETDARAIRTVLEKEIRMALEALNDE